MIQLSQRQILALLLTLGVAAGTMFAPGVESAAQKWILLVAVVAVGALLYGLSGSGGPSIEPSVLLRAIRQVKDGPSIEEMAYSIKEVARRTWTRCR
jgi:hypothetical protein